MFKEKDIRPDKIFDQYLELSKKDKIYFKKSNIFISCPACNKKTSKVFLFIKHGHKYNQCKTCETIYVSPRPSLSQLINYYRKSNSAKFFADVFYKKTKKARIEHLWKPKVDAIYDFIKDNKEKYAIYDIGGGYGIFADLFNKKFKKKVTVIEPDKTMYNHCVKKKIPAINKFLENIKKEDLKKEKKLFLSFELFEHLQSPNIFLKILKKIMSPGDIFIFTTLSSSGADIQNLEINSKSFSIQHLNFFNPDSIVSLLNKHKFKVIKVETPGQLDIDILSKQSNHIKNKLLKIMIKILSNKQKKVLQKNLSTENLSSHMRVFCCV
jgi:2-polyprenyl-3-methyl-5-hydroxy-6-metoxy-1,4-benzoquinol methylase